MSICEKCIRPSCLHPNVCKNLNTDHSQLLKLYREVDKIPAVKKAFVGSGVRYDLSMAHAEDNSVNRTNREYLEQLITRHVSGRLKVAPEHTSNRVLSVMRKPSFTKFEEFKRIFDHVNKRNNLNQQLIPYFISSHPGSTEVDMAELAIKTKQLKFKLEQIQDFTPTPMTMATEIYYAGIDPFSSERVYSAHSREEKECQRQFFFWYKPEARKSIIDSLKRNNRPDLIEQLYHRPTVSKRRR